METQEATIALVGAYSADTIKLLQKAGLIGSGIKRILAKQSSTRKDKYDEGRKMWVQGKGELEIDRTDLREFTVPKKGTNGRILGDWRNGLTKAEVEQLIEEVGLPVFVVGETKNVGGEEVVIPDTNIPLFHFLEYDLSDPVQHSYWNIVKHSSLIAKSREECMVDDWKSYYVFDIEQEQRKEEESIDNRLAAVALANSTSDEVMEQVSWLMHYKGIEPLTGDITPKALRLSFKKACLDNKLCSVVVNMVNMQDREGYLALHRLISLGKVVAYGHDGPYHTQRTSASQDKGELLGNTESEAVMALRTHAFSYLLSSLKAQTAEEVEYKKNSDIGAAVSNVRSMYFKQMTDEKCKNSNSKTLRTWLNGVGISNHDDNTPLAKLREMVMAELSKGQ